MASCDLPPGRDIGITVGQLITLLANGMLTIVSFDTTSPGQSRLPNEGDTNVGTVKNMLETLCATRKVPDIEFFMNRRDFPILTRNGTEPYHGIWGENTPLVSHNIPKYLPILSMCKNKCIR